MLDDLDLLIEESVVFGELAAGTRGPWLTTQADGRLVAVLGSTTPANGKAADWTEAEKRFVVDNVRFLSDVEIARHLGRTEDAVHVYRERHLQLVARSLDPEWPTAREVARLLGVGCGKSVTRWIHEGFLPARALPLKTHMLVIPRQALVRWVVNPENWIYFKPHQVRDPYLRRLLHLRRQRWPDAWWTPGQAAAYHGVTVNAISAHIRLGRLPAKRWGNWWVKRSDAMALRILSGRDNHEGVDWTDACDAFLLLARALGFSYTAIAALCKWPAGRVAYRATTLLEDQDAIPRLIKQYDLKVHYCPKTARLFADWHDYHHRFPRLSAAIAHYRAGTATATDLAWVNHTLYTWAQWHAISPEQHHLAQCIRHASTCTAATVRGYHEALRTWGIDPLTTKGDNP